MLLLTQINSTAEHILIQTYFHFQLPNLKAR
jgi:hypothetical protein